MSTTSQPGTPGWLRTRNDRLALSLLLENGPLTRNRIGELSGLSKPTAAQMVARLENAGLISVVGEASNGRGPNAALYGVRSDRVRAVAIDISETTITSTVVDALDTQYPTVERSLPAHTRSPESDVRGAVAAAVNAANLDPATVQLVCVGVQAAISDAGDHLSFTDTLPGWPEIGARERIESALALDVIIENDVNLAAVAERSVGSTRDAGSFALLWMGDGLGVSVDLGGSVHRGAAGGAGEIGYLPIPRSAEGLVADAEDLTDLLGGEAVAPLLAELDGPDQDAALAALADRVSHGVIPVLAVLDPELVVLGGPTGAAGGPRLAELVAERLSGIGSRRLEHSARWQPAVRATGIAGPSVLGGARRMLVGRIHDRLVADISTP